MKIQMTTGWSKIATLMVTIVLCIFIGLTRFGVSTPQAQSPAMTKVLIGFNIQPGPPEEAMVRGVGGEIKYTYHLVPAIAATVPAQAMQGLRRNPNVTAVELDIEAHAIDAELDNAWGVKAIGAGTVHESESGNKGRGVRVAILDTGIDTDHPDLNFDSNCSEDIVNNDSHPEDGNSHGTHVAGTIAALDDENGVVGVAPEVTLCIYKVLNDGGSGNFSDIIFALQQAVEADVQITNHSYGSSVDPGSIVKAAFDSAFSEHGVLHIAAAGNSGNISGTGENCIFPARWGSVVATAATTQSKTRASFSSTCPEVELAAPGSQINSTMPGGGYGLKNGTSMASPHAAGVAALVWAANSSWNNIAVRNQLQATVDDLGDFGRDPHFGFGIVNAVSATGGDSGSDPGTEPGPPANRQPEAFDQSVTVTQGSSVDIILTGSDPDGDPLTFEVIFFPFNGHLTGSAPNLTYTPAPNSTADAFTFVVNDGNENSAPATVSITTESPDNPDNPADTVVITKATYNAKRDRLDMEATSSAGGEVTMMARAFDSSGNELGSVPLLYNNKRDKFKRTMTSLQSKPFRVEVSSSGGGSHSLQGSAIGGKAK